jgi:tetratricopeptide (TPR) repeat protein
MSSESDSPTSVNQKHTRSDSDHSSEGSNEPTSTPAHDAIDTNVDHEDHDSALHHQPKKEAIETPDDQTLFRLRSARELDRCNQLYYKGEFEDALVGYKALIKGLDDDKLLANLGYTLQALGQHQEAIKAFEKYLDTFIARHHAWKAQCYSYYHLKDYENMTRCAREAIRWDIRLNLPDDYSWQQMATAHFLMQDYSTALKATRKATFLNPKNPYAYYYEACIITALAEGISLDEDGLLEQEPSYEASLELLKKCLEIRPSLSDELRAEGYLNEVFTRLDQALSSPEDNDQSNQGE